LLDAVTGSHDIGSEPPAARWLDRRIGRAVRLLTRHWVAHVVAAHLLGWAGYALARAWHWIR
jgi:hypothetical protein